MENCLTCNAEIVQTSGKRKKLYCSALCRQKAWNKRQIIPEPEYKEGGLYRFENGGFVENLITKIASKVLVNSSTYSGDMGKMIFRETIIDADLDQQVNIELIMGLSKKNNILNLPKLPNLPLNKEDEKPRIGNDNICPISKEQCDDETCTPGAECNVSGSSIQNKPITFKATNEAAYDGSKNKTKERVDKLIALPNSELHAMPQRGQFKDNWEYLEAKATWKDKNGIK